MMPPLAPCSRYRTGAAFFAVLGTRPRRRSSCPSTEYPPIGDFRGLTSVTLAMLLGFSGAATAAPPENQRQNGRGSGRHRDGQQPCAQARARRLPEIINCLRSCRAVASTTPGHRLCPESRPHSSCGSSYVERRHGITAQRQTCTIIVTKGQTLGPQTVDSGRTTDRTGPAGPDQPRNTADRTRRAS